MSKYYIIIQIIILVLIILLLISCEHPSEGGWHENWIVKMNVESSDISYIEKGKGNCFFIPDPENPEEERMLIATSDNIRTMNEDGSDIRIIVDNILDNIDWESVNLSSNKHKIVFISNNSRDIYLANTEGTNLVNLTQTPDINELDPSFSLDDSKIVYCYTNIDDSTRIIAYREIDINTEVKIIEDNYEVFEHFKYPIFINNSTIYYSQIDRTENGNFSSTCGLYSANIDSGEQQELFLGIIQTRMSFNINRELFVFMKSKNGLNELILYNINNNEFYSIGDFSYYYLPSFSDDGLYLSIGDKIINTDDFSSNNIGKEVIPYTFCSFNSDSNKLILNI